jgi:hypothetical protein
MTDFQTAKRVRSRKQRQCPECRAGIGIGQTYRREAGSYDGEFYTAIMCEPCGAFTDRYVQSMRASGLYNSDEIAFTFGDIINEAAEHVELHVPAGRRLSMARKREAVHALFDAFDADHREYRRREQADRIAAHKLSHRIALSRIASTRMVRGMTASSASLPTPTERA